MSRFPVPTWTWMRTAEWDVVGPSETSKLLIEQMKLFDEAATKNLERFDMARRFYLGRREPGPNLTDNAKMHR